jgi:hypothetical protein
MVLIEINNNKGAFQFITVDSEEIANRFISRLKEKSQTLTAFIKSKL